MPVRSNPKLGRDELFGGRAVVGLVPHRLGHSAVWQARVRHMPDAVRIFAHGAIALLFQIVIRNVKLTLLVDALERPERPISAGVVPAATAPA